MLQKHTAVEIQNPIATKPPFRKVRTESLERYLEPRLYRLHLRAVSSVLITPGSSRSIRTIEHARGVGGDARDDLYALRAGRLSKQARPIS